MLLTALNHKTFASMKIEICSRFDMDCDVLGSHRNILLRVNTHNNEFLPYPTVEKVEINFFVLFAKEIDKSVRIFMIIFSHFFGLINSRMESAG